ncbi:hypothetical protein ACWD25_29945 [Streptomyces sp. NPDC002920]
MKLCEYDLCLGTGVPAAWMMRESHCPSDDIRDAVTYTLYACENCAGYLDGNVWINVRKVEPVDYSRKTADKVARIGNNATTHGIRGEFRYDRVSENRTTCGRAGITGTDSLMSGSPLEITCAACIAAGPRWIAYLHVDVPGRDTFTVTAVKSLEDAVAALRGFARGQNTDAVSASLYPFTPDNWTDAMEFRKAGCPFDYPSRLIERGARGGFRIVDA